MRRVVSAGWGTTLFLLSISVIAAIRLASIGAQTVRMSEDPGAVDPSSSDSVVAVVQPPSDDYISAAVSRAFTQEESTTGTGSGYRVFAPDLPPFLSESEALMETLDIVAEAAVTAVVVRPDTIEALQRASEIAGSGVLTVAVGALLPETDVHIRVGADPVELGSVFRDLLNPVLGPSITVGYLCGLCSGSEQIVVPQLIEAVGTDLAVEVQRVDDAELGSIAAAGALLRRAVDVVFADTVETTVAMAQVLIDANRVGEVRVIGFGDSPRVLSLVDDKVVDATIRVDIASAMAVASTRIEGSVIEIQEAAGAPAERVVLRPEITVIRPGDDPS